MDYTLKDLLDLPQLRNLLDSLNEVQSVSSAVLDLTGELLAGTLSPDLASSFPCLDADAPEARLSNQRRVAAIVSQGPGEFLYRFPTGLVDAALPIVVAGRHLGYVCAGQLFLAAPEQGELSNQTDPGGLDPAGDQSRTRKAPVVPEHLLRKHLEFCLILTQTLAGQGLRQLSASAIEGNRRENEGIYRSLFENTNDPILLINCGRFIDCNAAALRLLGYGSKLELLELCPFEISPERQPDGRSSQEKSAEMIATAMQSGYHQFEWLHSRANGTQVPVEVTLTPVTIAGELILHTLWRDITERKRIENALLRSEAKFRTLFDSTSDAVMLLNEKGFFDCNEATLSMFGCQSQYEFTRLHPGELSPPLQPCGTRSLVLAQQRIAEAFEMGSCRFEWIHRRTDNGVDFSAEVLLSALELDGKTVLQGTVRDISERKEAEKSLSYSVALTNATLDSTTDGILIVDREGKIVRWNQKFIELWKVPAELLDTQCKDRVLGWSLNQLADPEAFLGKVMELYRHPEATSQDLIELADGRLFDRYSQPLRIGAEIVGRFWTFRDITERRKAEERVADAMNYIQTILSASPVGIETFKATGETVSANEAAARIIGAPAEQLLRQNFRELASWQDSGMLESAERALTTGVAQRGDFQVATSFGERVHLDCLFVPFMFSGEQQLMLSIMDITERKQAEEKLLYSVSLIDAVFESTADGILVVELSGKIARWNRKFVDLWKIPEGLIAAQLDDPILSHNLDQMAHPEEFLAKVQELYQNPETSSEDLLELNDGRLFDRYSQPLSIGSEIVGRFWSFRDITERKRSEERMLDAKNYIQTILSHSPVGLETFKASGENVSANAAAARIVGAQGGELLQQNFRSVASWQRSGMLEMAERALATGVEQRGDCHVATTFGKDVDLDCLFVPFMFSGEQQLMLTMMDITKRKQAEEKLSYSFSLIDAVFESTDDGILVMELSGKIARWNRKFLELWKVPAGLMHSPGDDPVLEHVVSQLAQPAKFLAKIGELQQKPEESSEDLLELGDGRLIERYTQPLRMGSETVGRLLSFRDNTERRRLEEAVRRQNKELEQRVSERTQSLEDANCELLAINSELELRRNEAEETNKKLRQLSSAVENCSASIVIADSLGQIEYVNPKFCEVTGFSQEEVLGRNPRLLKANSQPKELYDDLWTTISTGREWSGDFCNHKKNGEIFWEHASISPIRSEQGEIINYVAVKEDITEQKRITGELLTAQEAALSANRAKSEFLANMSHEIRTPLSAIIGFSDLTLRTELQPRQHDYVQKILNAGDLLLSIINDILDFSKIEARQLEMEQITFRLETILANVTDIVQQKIVQKGLQLQIATAPDAALSLIGDQHRLSQIIVNLLSNSVKFTEQGRVALETTVEERETERIKLKFTVRDTGIGISEQLIKKLFQPFTQADGSTTRRFGGTGLGLSISKQLVQMMGGEIWCESKAGLGSTFSFTAWFGLGEPSGTARNPSVCSLSGESMTVPDFSGTRILLAEDNEINMLLASELLDETGTLVDHAINGQEAVKMVAGGTVRYDLVLMDLQMPVLDGYQACRIIRNDSRFSELPIIAMTAHAMTEVQHAVLDAGMNAMVTKPINRWNLLRVMQSFLPEQGAPGRAGVKTGVAPRQESAATSPGFPGQGCAEAAQLLENPSALLDCAVVSPILNQLLDYIKGSNGKAERYLDSYQRELTGLPKHDLNQIKVHLKNFDFSAARRAILSLAKQNSIHLSAEHTGEYHT